MHSIVEQDIAGLAQLNWQRVLAVKATKKASSWRTVWTVCHECWSLAMILAPGTQCGRAGAIRIGSDPSSLLRSSARVMSNS
jgi:hypothetical protein